MHPIAIAYLVMSVVTLAVYGWDKARARSGGDRVPERTLHLLALAGGWPGALAGQQWFRHKTQKRGFQVVFWLTVVVHAAAWGLWWAGV